MKLDYLISDSLSEQRKMVAFVVGDVRYALDIMTVREIVNPGQVVQTPASPPHVIGVTDHREAVVPVVSLRLRFGLEPVPRNPKEKWILVRTADGDIGLEVDQVVQVIKVDEEQNRGSSALVDHNDEPWITQVYAVDEGLVFELDIATLVSGAAIVAGGDEG